MPPIVTGAARRLALAALVLVPACAHPAAEPAPRPTASASSAALRAEVEALNAAMVAAFRQSPASVARFYTDDARILGGGGRYEGRAEVDRYWAQATGFADWSLEVLEVGGTPDAPWQLGRSTLTGQGGRTMTTEFIGLLRRQPDGALRFRVDMFVAAGGPARGRRP